MIISKVMSRQGLRTFLRETSSISEQMAKLKKMSSSIIDDNFQAKEMEALVEQARHLVSTMNIETLGVMLPDRHGLFFFMYFDIVDSRAKHYRGHCLLYEQSNSSVIVVLCVFDRETKKTNFTSCFLTLPKY